MVAYALWIGENFEDIALNRGHVRIIGGEWRGRKLKVPENVRPTPNRVRETVFNWLTTIIPGAYCLDAYAGSGAFGFEALSRGAAHVVMLDHSAEVVALLREELALFKGHNAEIYCAKAPQQLKKPTQLFDVVFLDPPYKENILITCFYLEEKKFLSSNATIYLETSLPVTEQDLPLNWKIMKSKTAGQVAYHLVRRQISNDEVMT